MLQQEEKKLLKRIEETRQKAAKMQQIKTQNEKEFRERMQAKLLKEQELEKDKERFQKEKQRGM